MKMHITLILLSLCFLNCKGQEKGYEIVDPIAEPLPFYIEAESTKLVFPDSLMETIQSGFVILSVYVDKNKNYLGFNINKMKVEGSIQTNNIDYFNIVNNVMVKAQYPEKVQMLHDPIKRYVETLSIGKNPGVIPEELNQITFMARF